MTWPSGAPDLKWKRPDEFAIVGIPNAVKFDGLIPTGRTENRVPRPRELNVQIVDAEAAKVVNRLFRIANGVPGGREVAGPVVEAANYISRLAAMPCGVSDLVGWLSGTEIDERQRSRYSWSTYYASLMQFDKSGVASDQRSALLDCMRLGSQLYENYDEATPFALLVANHVGHAARNKQRHVLVIFTSPLYKLLAERFLDSYEHFPDGVKFSTFHDRVGLVPSSRLEEQLENSNDSEIIFAGLDDESLRVLMTDDRVPAHTVVLLTQRGGQYLRAVLKPLVERFEEFKPLKPRMESILRQLKSLPDDASILSTSDLILPSFRIELSSILGPDAESSDPEAWTILLEVNRPGN